MEQGLLGPISGESASERAVPRDSVIVEKF
jgi:hypothetical protein